jgi:uncharacterized membrane protein HdeD (DUF308 family)
MGQVLGERANKTARGPFSPPTHNEREETMKLLGIALIIFGVAALMYHAFTLMVPTEAVRFGELTISAWDHRSIPWPPIVGGVSLVAGIALVLLSGTRLSGARR